MRLISTIVCLIFIIVVQISCSNNVQQDLISANESLMNINANMEFQKHKILSWPIKDLSKDSIPGTSLEFAYDEFLSHENGDTIVIALIDMPVNINHPMIKDNIWRNNDEIEGNNKDVANGYVDDIYGIFR